MAGERGAQREPPPLQCVFKEIPKPSWVPVLHHGAQVHPFQSKRWQVPGARGEVDPPGSTPPFSCLTPHRPGEAPGPSSNRELCPVEAGGPGEGSVHTTPHKPRPHPGPALIDLKAYSGGVQEITLFRAKKPSLDACFEAPAILFRLGRPPRLGPCRLPGFEMRDFGAGRKAGVSAPV